MEIKHLYKSSWPACFVLRETKAADIENRYVHVAAERARVRFLQTISIFVILCIM